MPSDPSARDPRTIWQGQPGERSAVTLEKLIRRKAQESHAKTLRERWGGVAGFLGILAFSGFAVRWGFNPMGFAIAIAWSFAGVMMLNRGDWPARISADAALATGLEFCRKEIERRIYVHRRFLLWSFAPILLALGAFVVPAAQIALKERAGLANMMPFLTLSAIWIVVVFLVRQWKWGAMQRELAELNELERESQS